MIPSHRQLFEKVEVNWTHSKKITNKSHPLRPELEPTRKEMSRATTADLKVLIRGRNGGSRNNMGCGQEGSTRIENIGEPLL